MPNSRLYKVQLPNDVRLVGYRRSLNNRFEFESVWRSESAKYEGTEQEFVDNRPDVAYCYVEIDKYTRRIVK